jgi:hypothetical protein
MECVSKVISSSNVVEKSEWRFLKQETKSCQVKSIFSEKLDGILMMNGPVWDIKYVITGKERKASCFFE